MNIAKYFVLIIEVILWLITFVYTYEYFTHTKKNRYKFKYWAIISVFSMLQIIFIIIYNNTSSSVALMVINFLYIIIAFNMLEIFMYISRKILTRKKEVFCRILFLTSLICYTATSNIIFAIPCLIIIAVLSLITNNNNFLISHFLYSMYIMYVSNTDYVNNISIFFGFMYTVHIMYCIRKMYLVENVEERILKGEKYD